MTAAMRHTVFLSIAGLACFWTNSLTAADRVWNPATEFSILNGNPNGVWSYGYMNSAFTTFGLHNTGDYSGAGGGPVWYASSASSPPLGSVWKNTAAYAIEGVNPGQVSVHPCADYSPASIRWTAPADVSGYMTVTGRFCAGNSGVMRVALVFNGKKVWGAIDSGVFAFSTNVVPGNTLDFAVYGGFGGGATPVDAVVRVTPTVTRHYLTVQNARGAASPTNGIYELDGGTALSPFVPPYVTEGATRYVCLGAAVTGNAYTQVDASHVTLTLTNNAVLTWRWQEQYQLLVASAGGGSVTGQGWYGGGSNAVLTASPSSGYRFVSWNDGDTSPVRTIIVPVGGASYTALFAPLPRGVIRFQKATYSTSEGSAVVKLTVERAEGAFGEATVQCQASGGTAELGPDFAFDTTTLYWADGSTGPRSVYVEILDDADREGAEVFQMYLTGITGAGLGTPAAADVTIADNEAPSVISPRFSNDLAFGVVATNSCSTLTVQLWNDGNDSLAVTNVWVPACFSVTQRVFTVPAESFATIAVTFAPAAVGPYAGFLTLGCNATTGVTALALTGEGVAPAYTRAARVILGQTASITVDVPDGATGLGLEDELAPGLIPLEISDGGSWDAVTRKVKWFFNEPGQIRDRTLQYRVSAAGTVVSGAVNFGAGNQAITGDTSFTASSTPSLLHPADDDGDWRVALQEVSACVARWKTGIDDYTTPVVVRGITLYLRGEQYTFDPTVSAEAKRWIPIIPDLAPSSLVPNFKTSALAPAPVPGAVRIADSTNVTITVTPEADTLAWGLDEAVAEDVQIRAISHNGTWDATHRKIKWVFPDGAPRTVSYSIEGDAGAITPVAGTASFDGSESPVSGTDTLAIPLPFLTWAERRGLSGTQEDLFEATDANSGQPNALAYAFGTNLTSETRLLGLRVADGVALIDTPEPSPAAKPFVDVFVVGTADLSDGDWPIVLLPTAAPDSTAANRYYWKLPSPLPQCFFRVRVAPK